MTGNVLANRLELLIDFSIGISQNPKPPALQIGVPALIVGVSFLEKMLAAIHFNNEIGRSNEEINDIAPQNLLPPHRNRELLEEIIPQVPLLRCHILPQVLGPGVGHPSPYSCASARNFGSAR